MTHASKTSIAFAPEDEFLGDTRRVPSGFHLLALRPYQIRAMGALYAPQSTDTDPEGAALDRILAIDEGLEELQAQHADYTNELQLVTVKLDSARRQETARLAALGRPLPAYCAPLDPDDGSDEDAASHWNGINPDFLSAAELIETYSPRRLAAELEDAGYFALKSLRTKISHALDEGRGAFSWRELAALLGDQIKRARPVAPAAIDGIAEQLRLLTNPPKKLVPATRPVVPPPVTETIDELLARPMHEQVAAMGLQPQAPLPTSAPPVPAEVLVEEALPFNLQDVLVAVRRELRVFEAKNELLVRANREARANGPDAGLAVLWESFGSRSSRPS